MPINPLFLKLGITIISGILIAFGIVTATTPQTVDANLNNTTSFEDVVEEAGKFPVDAFIDMVVDGVWKFSEWVGNLFARALEWLLGLIGWNIHIPEWFAFVLFMILLIFFIMTQFHQISNFLISNLSIVLGIVIALMFIAFAFILLGVVPS